MWRGLYFLVVIELLLGGGGRLLDIGPVTLRMLLFAAAIVVTIGLALHGKTARSDMTLALALVLTFFVVHLPPIVQGAVRGVPAPDIFAEIQPLMYWLIAPFFAYALQYKAQVVLTAALVRWAGALLGSAYLLVLFALALGLVDFPALYMALGSSGEFAFRGESFFVYKGFVFVGVALVFIVAIDSSWRKTLALLIAAALILTLTRGFVLSTSAAILLMLLVTGRKRTVALGCAGAVVALTLVWVYLPALDENLTSRYEESDSVRQRDMTFMRENIEASTLAIGNGFGARIDDQLNIENTYLWIVWKTGTIGLLFWMFPLLLCWHAYSRAVRRPQALPLANAYFFSVVLIYLQTATNPYLNNPIGLSFVLLATFSLRTLARGSPASLARSNGPARRGTSAPSPQARRSVMDRSRLPTARQR